MGQTNEFAASLLIARQAASNITTIRIFKRLIFTLTTNFAQLKGISHLIDFKNDLPLLSSHRLNRQAIAFAQHPHT